MTLCSLPSGDKRLSGPQSGVFSKTLAMVAHTKRSRKPPLITSILSNAQDMSRLHPDTFTAPSQEQLNELKVGDVVKICVPDPGERFWCTINAVDGQIVTAEVCNMLLQIPWPMGMKLRFHRDCVYEV